VLTGMVAAGLCLDALSRFLGLAPTALYDHIVRLGLRTPPDAPFRSAGARGWSEEDVRRLIAWRPIGVHPEVIGDSLSKPRKASAVRAKCRRVGLAAPPRGSLFRPDPAALRRLSGLGAAIDPLAPVERYIRPVGPLLPGFEPAPQPARPKPPRRASATSAPTRPEGQHELGLLGDVAGTGHALPAVPETPRASPTIVPPAPAPAAVSPIPQNDEEVDFSSLTWIGRLRSPATYRQAVYAIGMLLMSGLHYRVAAEMTGRSAASLRTIRTRIGVPVDQDRGKTTLDFDIDVANATRVLGNWIVRKGMMAEGQRGPASYFWVQKHDRSTWYPPSRRTRDHLIEGRSPHMTIITRGMLDEAAARGRPLYSKAGCVAHAS
jgi:hypothetical protein